MHIPDGILEAPLCISAAVVAGGAAAAAFRGVTDRQVPRLAVMTALFFVVGTLHVRLGPGSVHLLLTGLMAVVLGWRSFLAVVAGVLMHATLLHHGGLTTIGVNALVLGLPALVVGAVVSSLGNVGASARRAWCVGAGATVATYCLSFGLFVLAALLADDRIATSMGVLAAAHLPAMLVEAVVTGSAVAFLTRVDAGGWVARRGGSDARGSSMGRVGVTVESASDP